LADDWVYLTAPNVNFNIKEALMPQESFWRPLDALFGGLMGKIPSLFPILNRALVVSAHILSAFFTGKILDELNFKTKSKVFSVLFFSFSSATISVIVSPDALNQSFCLLFGLIGLYLYLRKNNFIYLTFVLISVFCKESGIAFLAVIPPFGTIKSISSFKDIKIKSEPVKRLIICAVIAVIFVAAYFALRFALYGSVALGGESSRYSVSVFSFSTIKNIYNMFLISATGVDSVAILLSPRNYILVALTVLLSLVFIAYMIVCFIHMIKAKSGLYGFVVIIISALILAAPQAVIASSGEMHAYPVLFAVAVLYGYLLEYSDKKQTKKAVAFILPVFIAFAISSTHKMITIYDYSEKTKELTENLYENYKDKSDKELILININGKRKGYSVFSQTPVCGTDFGKSLRQYYGWKKLNIYSTSRDSEEKAYKIAKEKKTEQNIVLITDGTSVKEFVE
ncbi:MAG: hypothetical protein KBT46_05170, partial [Ruminococcus sp.]|nr:hypothetical protein [Candidatus Copronaster equi]